MPALNFKAQFVPQVENWKKRCSIRAMRKRPIVLNDTLYLYTGMRTSRCRLLHTVTCCEVLPVSICYRKILVVRIGGRTAPHEYLRRLARADGFDCLQDFVAFFRDTHGLPFKGQLIFW